MLSPELFLIASFLGENFSKSIGVNIFYFISPCRSHLETSLLWNSPLLISLVNILMAALFENRAAFPSAKSTISPSLDMSSNYLYLSICLVTDMVL